MATRIASCGAEEKPISCGRKARRAKGTSRIELVLMNTQRLSKRRSLQVTGRDLVPSKDHSGALVTIIDRSTSFTASKQINNESSQTATEATSELLRPFKGASLIITADNGKEFAYHDKMTKVPGAQV